MARLVLLIVLGLPSLVLAQEIHVGGHFRNFEEYRKVVDLRCTVCHTRERVDTAVREQRDMQEIQTRMIERGARLTEQEKDVLGTFWGSPFRDGDGPAPVGQ